MKPRTASLKRQTNETQVELTLNLDGTGVFKGDLQLGFLRHMLELLARHAAVDLDVAAKGDLHVDDHHLTEDIAIVLGQALAQALGEKKGIERYGFAILPMDEVLVAVAVDLGGRFVFASNYLPHRDKVGDLSTELVSHFFRALALEARMNLHFKFLSSGENEHHRVEAMFKGFARSLRMAVKIDHRVKELVPSTKGVL